VGCVVRLGKTRTIANCMRQRCQNFGAGGTFDTFIGVFAKLRKATINLIMSVRVSVCTNDTTGVPMGGFSWKFMFEYVSENCRENSSFIKTDQELRALFMKTAKHFWSYLVQFFLEWQMFETKSVEEIKTHILCPITVFSFFRKSCRL
jgi:hypothetical protein